MIMIILPIAILVAIALLVVIGIEDVKTKK